MKKGASVAPLGKLFLIIVEVWKRCKYEVGQVRPVHGGDNIFNYWLGEFRLHWHEGVYFC